MKKKKKMTALILAVALMASSVRLDGTAAESIASEEMKEQAEMSETELQEDEKNEEEKEIIIADETDNDDDDKNDIQEIESEFEETTETEVQEGTQLETIENDHQEETQTETVTSETQEELQTESTEEELSEGLWTESTKEELSEGLWTESTEEEAPEGLQAESTEEEASEGLQAESTEEELPEGLQTESTEEELQEETVENAYMMQLDGEEELLENDVDNEREFALQDGNTDITSGKFGAVLAHVTLPEELGSINNEDYIKTLNPRITGADGNANGYFRNLHLIAENREEDTTAQYQLVGDIKAEAPTATYTVTMTAGGKSDTATFAIVEKGIESLKINGIPSVVSSEKKVNIKPILEINGDLTGNDKTTMPKNKKMTWELVSVEGAAMPSSLKINAQNGTITVNEGDNGAFRIKAITEESRYTDAEGKPISATSETVEVVSDNDQRLESLIGCTIVLVDSSDPAKAQLLHQTGKTADMSSLDGTKAYVKIQKADGSFINAENYVIKANNKAFQIGADTSVTCVLTKPIKSGKTLTVTLTATLVNGKKEQPLKGQITVQSAPAGEQDLSLALGVSGTGRSELKDDGRMLEFNGSASTLIKMELMKNGTPVGSSASYNLKFKNLKKVSETISKDSIVVYATLRTASGTVTLTDCSTGKTTTYEVKNVEKTAAVGKSPTIKQRTSPASNTGPDYVITTKGKVVTDYTHVRVELLPADYIKSCKNRNAQGKYHAFASALGLDPYGSDKAFKVYEVEPEDNTFRIPFVKAEQPAKGSYKLQMTVGKMTGSRFVATAVPVIVTTKVSGNRAEPERVPQEQHLSRIEGVLAVTNQAEYDKILPPDVWTGRPENFTDVSPIYEMVSSSNKITVKGSLKKVEGFTGFSDDEKNQSGYYLLVRVKLPTLKENGSYASMTGTLKALNDKTLTSADLTVEGADIYLDIFVKVADADAMTAADMTLTLDYDGAGLTYTESTYTFDLNNVILEKDKETEDVKVLVVYFSATNTTKGVAKKIANGIDADLYEIVPEVPYTSADLNYNNPDSRANKEMNDSNARPAISGSVENMEQYDIVFIGYPIWWGQAPKIMCTFMESYDFSGKTIVPFCTSGSSGIGSSATNLQSLTNGAIWVPGRRFSGSASQNTIMEWVRGLGLNLGE